MGIGAMRERLEILDPTPQALRVSSLTRSGTTATAQTVRAHGFVQGDYVTLVGAVPAGYNSTRIKIVVTDTRTFTYTVASGLTTPATGTVFVTYVSDAQGGRKQDLRSLATFFAELIPQTAREGRQLEGVASQFDLRFKAWVRTDVMEKMLVRWTPRYPPGAATRELQIHGIQPADDGTQFMFIDVGEAR